MEIYRWAADGADADATIADAGCQRQSSLLSVVSGVTCTYAYKQYIIMFRFDTKANSRNHGIENVTNN